MNSVAASSFMVLLITIGTLLTGVPDFLHASTDGDGDSSGDEPSEEESTDGKGSDENGSNDSDDGGNDNESPATTPVSPTDPSAAEEAERIGEQEQDGDDGNKSGPLPYCDTSEGEAAQSCHDRDDYDEDTGLYPCNDGTQRDDPANCPDVTKPVLPQQPQLGPSSNTVVINTFSIQGSGLPPLTGPLPVPKEGEALLKVIYEGDWSGNILDSNLDSASYDGTGNYAIVFPCADLGIYSLTAQKMNEGNDLMQLVVQDYTNQTLDSGQTTAEFGIVSLSGEC